MPVQIPRDFRRVGGKHHRVVRLLHLRQPGRRAVGQILRAIPPCRGPLQRTAVRQLPLCSVRDRGPAAVQYVAKRRRAAKRYDKLAAHFLAFVQLASIRLWLGTNESTTWHRFRRQTANGLLLNQRRPGRDVMADDLPFAVLSHDDPGDLHRQRRSVDDEIRGARHVDHVAACRLRRDIGEPHAL